VLGHIGRGTAVLSAEGEALDEAQRHQQDRRRPSDSLELGQEAHEARGATHEDDRHQERVLAAYQVPDAAEDDRAEGADQEAGRVRREGGEQRGGLVTRGEEQRREEGRKDRVKVEVVPLEYSPE